MDISYVSSSIRWPGLIFALRERSDPQIFASAMQYLAGSFASLTRSNGTNMPLTTSTAASSRMVGKLQAERTVMLLCDMQERFRSKYWKMPTVIQSCRYMLSVAHVLNIPILATQQSSHKFGTIIQDCFANESIQKSVSIFEKEQFSMLTDQVQSQLNRLNRESYIIMGIETQVCVQQTCFELLEQGAQVHVIVDGVTSQQPIDRQVALAQLQQSGAYLTTAQSAAFMLMQTQEHPNFDTVLKLTLEHLKSPNEFNQALL